MAIASTEESLKLLVENTLTALPYTRKQVQEVCTHVVISSTLYDHSLNKTVVS